MPVIVALRTHPEGDLRHHARMRAVELFTMYIVTAFALGYSSAKLHMSRDLFLNITFAVGAISCVTLPLFAWLADRVGLKRVYMTGAIIGAGLRSIPFFLAMEARSVFWIVVFSLLLANVAHDMVNSVQQPLFTSMFGTEYRYSGANVGYQIASRRVRRLHAVHRHRAARHQRHLAPGRRLHGPGLPAVGGGRLAHEDAHLNRADQTAQANASRPRLPPRPGAWRRSVAYRQSRSVQRPAKPPSLSMTA